MSLPRTPTDKFIAQVCENLGSDTITAEQISASEFIEQRIFEHAKLLDPEMVEKLGQFVIKDHAWFVIKDDYLCIIYKKFIGSEWTPNGVQNYEAFANIFNRHYPDVDAHYKEMIMQGSQIRGREKGNFYALCFKLEVVLDKIFVKQPVKPEPLKGQENLTRESVFYGDQYRTIPENRIDIFKYYDENFNEKTYVQSKPDAKAEWRKTDKYQKEVEGFKKICSDTKYKTEVERIIAILKDYTQDDSAWCRFWAGYWNRNHLDAIKAIYQNVNEHTTESDLLKNLKKIKLDNQEGSCAIIIDYLERKGVQVDINKNDQSNEKTPLNSRKQI